jgi:type II secretory pathway pseudopilin PulG
MKTAFSLVELLVVITIIVVLLAMLMPAMDKAIEQAQRVVCAANQHVINVGAMSYGMNNKKYLFICQGRSVPVGFYTDSSLGATTSPAMSRPGDKETDWMGSLATVGLASANKQPIPADPYDASTLPVGSTGHMPGKMWDCPSRSQKSYYDLYPNGGVYHAVVMGYMYYGGLAHWVSPYRQTLVPAPAPQKITDSPGRALTSDVTAKFNGRWNRSGIIPHFKDTPPHTDGDSDYPAGHNQSFLNGSVQWIEADRMLMFHSWNNTVDQLFFYWQEDLGGLTPAYDDYLKNQI